MRQCGEKIKTQGRAGGRWWGGSRLATLGIEITYIAKINFSLPSTSTEPSPAHRRSPAIPPNVGYIPIPICPPTLPRLLKSATEINTR